MHVLQIARVANCTFCKLRMLQIARVANCTCYKLQLLQIAYAQLMHIAQLLGQLKN